MNKIKNRYAYAIALTINFLTGVCTVQAATELKKSGPQVELNRAIKVRYTNYRGETATRSIVPMEIYWGKTEYHPHDQWLLRVFDVEKDAERVYAFKDIKEIME